MSESKPPEKKKPCRGLSISKTKKNAFEKATPSKVSPILAYFNNAPPAKFACPICGELVPRYGMNKHLDEVCQKDQQGHDDDVLLVEPVKTLLTSKLSDLHPKNCINSPSPKKALEPETRRSPDSSIFEENTKQKTSPYFGKCTVDDNMDIQTVNTVELQSLSSKLSKRNQKPKRELSESNAKTSPIVSLRSEAKESINSDNVCSSQKENHQLKNSMILGSDAKKHTTVTENMDILNIASRSEKAGCRLVCDQSMSINSLDLMLCSKQEHPEVLIPLKTKRSCQPRVVAKVSNRQDKTVSCTESCMVEPGDAFSTESPSMTKDVAATVADMDSVNKMDNCHVDGGMEVLTVEDLNDLDNEIIQGLLEPFEEKDLKNEICENANSAMASLAKHSGNPYYLRNFLMVLQTIMDNEDDMSLFDEQDSSILSAFLKLSAGSQKLYVRLFQRKLNWLKVNKIEYTEIAADLSPMIEELIHAGFIQTEAELLEVAEVLDLLPAPDLKTLAKTFRLDNPNGQKQHLVESFLRLAKQRSIFSFGKSQPGIGAVILKRAKEVAGRCVRVCKAPRNVFSRVLMLFSLTDSMEMEEAASGGQTQLSTVLMVNMGRTTFPTYTVNRQSKIFQDREDLIRFEMAMHTLIDIVAAMGNGKWDEANQLYQCAKESWNQLKDHPNNRHHEKLPVYLRCFTVGWIYARIRSRGVEILQRLHLYEEAVNELQSLLSQTVYCPDSRGRWWDRLALNLHQHLKCTEKAVGHVLEGLADPFVRTGHQLALYHRALRIRDSASCKKFRHLFENMPEMQVEDVEHVTIKGKMFPHSGTGKSVFLLQELCDDEDGEDISVSTVMCSVEDLALAHYKQQGYDQGIHGEGSTFSTLYSLLMWDIIFMEGVPDVFRNSYQAFPLDLYTDHFFENRRSAIETRLELLKEANRETLEQMIVDVWNSEEGKAAALVNWERFTSLQQAQSLVACFGGPFLSGVCRRLSKDLRHCRGGLPDLVVWNTKNNSFKVVEVKGPNDRLSHKQMIWLDELRKLGADVEVCHVVAIGAKSLHIG